MGVGGVALLASILGNLKQYGESEELGATVEALKRLVEEWQIAYQNLDAQLALVLRTNEEQSRLINSLREEVRRTSARSNAAEARALSAELGRRKSGARESGAHR